MGPACKTSFADAALVLGRAAGGASQLPTAAECLGRFWSLAPPAMRAADMRSLLHDQPLSLVCYLPDDREQVQRPDTKEESIYFPALLEKIKSEQRKIFLESQLLLRLDRLCPLHGSITICLQCWKCSRG